MQQLPPLFKEPGHEPVGNVPMTDEEYSKVLDVMVVVCADAVIVNRERKTIYLAKRKAKPMQGWWIIGGRVRSGEEPLAAIHRKFLHETGVDVSEERFKFISFIRHQWKDRQQQPQTHGVDDLSYTFVVELSQDELTVAHASLDEKEYEKDQGLTEFTKEKLEQENVHPSLLHLYNLIFP